MKTFRRALFILLPIHISGCMHRAPPNISPVIAIDSLDQNIRQTLRAVRRLIAVNASSDTTYLLGSAVVFGGKALTANHVFYEFLKNRNFVENAQLMLLSPNNPSDSIEVELVASRTFSDGALLTLLHNRREERICFSGDYQIGDTVYIAGYPTSRNYELTVVRSVLVAPSIHEALPPGTILGTGETGGGMSGGPAINSRGCVIGIHRGGIEKYPPRTASANIRWFEDWITDNN